MILTSADVPLTNFVQYSTTFQICQEKHKWQIKYGEWVCDRCRQKSGIKFGEPMPKETI